MGVLNVTPDSFSDGGRYVCLPAALSRAEQMLADNAAIIDVGGESTRPGAAAVDEATELRRVLPVVEALAGRCTVSIDTRKENVARACVRAGAAIINDTSASLDTVAADLGVGWIAMHMRGTPATMQIDPQYDDVVANVVDYLAVQAQRAQARGVSRVWVDPGLGFGKRVEHNFQLLKCIDRFVAMGVPVVLGASRKSFIGAVTNQPVPVERCAGSVAVAVFGALAGVDLIRTHDVRETEDALRVAHAILDPASAARTDYKDPASPCSL